MTLIERIEAAEGPSLELDLAISSAFNTGRSTDPRNPGPMHYTTSIDAALTLLPEGYQHGYATIPKADILRAPNHCAQAYVDGSDGQDFSKYFRAEAATPALALLSAILKARKAGVK